MIIAVVEITYAPLAQLDRAFGYEPKGRGFESLKARQSRTSTRNAARRGFLFADFFALYFLLAVCYTEYKKSDRQ